jgi:hypothetical protein
MEVKKVGCFSVNEVEALRGAGTILGNTVKALENGEIDAVDARDIDLINALTDVLSRLSFYTGADK